MLEAAHYYLFVFGILTIAGGVMGFVKAKSKPSLIAGSIAGGLLLTAGWLMGTQGRSGVFLGLDVSLALAIQFGKGYARSRKVMPAGMMAALSAIAVVLTLLVIVR